MEAVSDAACVATLRGRVKGSWVPSAGSFGLWARESFATARRVPAWDREERRRLVLEGRLFNRARLALTGRRS